MYGVQCLAPGFSGKLTTSLLRTSKYSRSGVAIRDGEGPDITRPPNLISSSPTAWFELTGMRIVHMAALYLGAFGSWKVSDLCS